MQPEPGLCLVSDADDRPEHAEFLAGLADLGAGRVVCVVTPDLVPRLPSDAGRALGKRGGHAGRVRNLSEEWREVKAWYIAEGVRELFVTRAHLLDRSQWEQLATLACICGARLWLICQGGQLRRGQKEFLGDWPTAEFTWSEFAARWEAGAENGTRQAPTATKPLERVFPDVPSDDFPLFRARCRELLGAEDFALVDGEFREAFEGTSTWTVKKRSELDEEHVAGHLRDLVGDSLAIARTLTRLRGAQVAFLRAGYLVNVNLDGLVTAWEDSPRREISPTVAAILRRYRSPRHAAAAALSLGLGLEPQDLEALELGDVAGDGSWVRHGDETLAVPELVRAHIRALVVERLLSGADPSAPFFVFASTSRGGRAASGRLGMTARSLQLLLRAMAAETGLLLLPRRATPARSEAAWMRRRGVSVQQLAPSYTRAKAHRGARR